MIEDASMFIVDNQQQGVVPAGTRAQRVIDGADQALAFVNRKIWMLAIGKSPALHVVVIGRLDKRVFRQVSVGSICFKIVKTGEAILLTLEVAIRHQNG